VFELDDSGFSRVRVDPVPQELVAEALAGAAACPVAAIAKIESPDGIAESAV